MRSRAVSLPLLVLRLDALGAAALLGALAPRFEFFDDVFHARCLWLPAFRLRQAFAELGFESSWPGAGHRRASLRP